MSAPNQAPSAPAQQAPQGGPPHGGPQGEMKKLKPIFHLTPWFILAALAILCFWLWHQWDQLESDNRYQKTDNASVGKEITLVDAQISGYIKQIYFDDFQYVKEGDLLVELVDDQYQAALNHAKAEVSQAQAQLDNLAYDLRLQKAGIEQATAHRENANASLELAERDYQRFKQLSNTGAVTKQEYDRAKAALDQAHSQLKAQKAAVSVQQHQLAVLESKQAERQASLDIAKAHLASAEINLSYTKITAPRNGFMGKREIQVGSLVTPRTQVAALIQDTAPYVIANYKETQLTNVKQGQSVSILVDTFPNQTLTGKVRSLSPASGTALSLLMADNATGNFTKVVQRIPVRIDLDPDQPLLSELRGGMSVTTIIDTETEGSK